MHADVPVAPPPAPVSQDDRSMAMLAHVLQIVSWWIGPLIIFIVKRNSAFASFHAAQALIWQLCLTAFWVLLGVFWMATMFSTLATHTPGTGGVSAGPPPFFFLVFILLWAGGMLGWVITLLLAILFGIKSYNGEWARYPVIGRWAQRIVRVPVG